MLFKYGNAAETGHELDGRLLLELTTNWGNTCRILVYTQI